MRNLILSFLLACSIFAPACDANPESPFTLYLVRHAEKLQDDSGDPHLSAAGKQRAANLADWFSDKSILDIWSSDYNRTRATAEPSAKRIDADLTIYDPGDLTSLAKTLLARQHSAIIIGHSNTTPDLARILCDCEIEDMDDSEYDRLIVVSVSADGTQVKTIRQR